MKAETSGPTSGKKLAAKKGAGASSTDRWTLRYEECKEFAKKSGHCKIPIKYADNKSLGIWVQEQRRNFKLLKTGKPTRSKALTGERIKKLDGIGFHWGFTPDPNQTAETDASWDANYAKLVERREDTGDFDVPVEEELGKWVRAQRFQYNLHATKRKTFITKDRIRMLEDIDFDWDGPRKID